MNNRPDWLSIIVLTLPMLLSVLSWFLLSKSAGKSTRNEYLLCGVISISAAWLLSAIALPDVLGPSYSGLRFAILYGNAFAMFVAGAIVFGQKRMPLVPAAIGAFILTILWLLASYASSFAP